MNKALFKKIKRSLLTLACTTVTFGTFVNFVEGINLPTAPGSKLTASYYTVTPAKGSDIVTINANKLTNDDSNSPLKSALEISSGKKVIIDIPENVILEVYGKNGFGQTGGSAGIFVPENSVLIIVGNGTLKAIGGRAGNGSNGEDGTDGLTRAERDDNKDKGESGAGGRGGNGGGGAGAGIGGSGGHGGSGGLGGKKVVSYDGSPADGVDGKRGADGTDGEDGICGGIVLISSSVDLEIVGGDPGSDGRGGTSGTYGYYNAKGKFTDYSYGGGGGSGSGGLGGKRAVPIGKGAGGGGGGAGGGSGAAMSNDMNESPIKKGSGAGSGAGQGFTSTNNKTDKSKRKLKWGSNDPVYAGEAGNLGKSGAASTGQYWSFTLPVSRSLWFNDDFQNLISTPSIECVDTGCAEETDSCNDVPFKFTYSLDNENWSDEIPVAKRIGNYTIYYRIQSSDDNANDIFYSGSLKSEIKMLEHSRGFGHKNNSVLPNSNSDSNDIEK